MFQVGVMNIKPYFNFSGNKHGHDKLEHLYSTF